MSQPTSNHSGTPPADNIALDKHPPGLYVLFVTEMWERFSFYTMLAMFTLYLQDGDEGFSWTKSQATGLYANYLMFVYASPLVGGFLANWKLGFRNAVMLGGLFFIAGHLLLSFRSLNIVYAALTCLVIGNGLFKPNISVMVGNLYPPGSRLKERAYNIFYMGINIGAFLAPVTAEFVQGRFGFHPAFAVAAAGMVISVAVLWTFKRHVEEPGHIANLPASDDAVSSAAVTEDLAPAPSSPTDHAIRVQPSYSAGRQAPSAPAPLQPIDRVPDWKRIGALLVIFLIVIVFWMVFHQNGSTLTYWANDNTDWEVSGIISNAINPFWVVTLTFPLIYFWKWLDSKGWEPSTPTKMAIGMVMTGVAFLVMYAAALVGEGSAVGGTEDPLHHRFRVSPAWLVGAYAVLTLAELMLSPMGLALVAKVAPPRHLGVMMGGWFVAGAIGNKLTQIGQLWEYWRHSSFWLLLSGLSFGIAVVLLLLLRPLKKAMPGV
jgi:proton-dependent oligopeptide transporter, POT family